MRAGEQGGDPASSQAAVRLVMRELFLRCADARGLRVPAGVLPITDLVDEGVADQLRASVLRFDLTDVEGFGYAYESLLGAKDRKHAGAHYTPRALAEEVVEHALDPLVDHHRDPHEIRILDLAVGSGVFLVSAARFLAARSPERTMRDIVTTCLYGADVNPTAVEICKLSLWLLAADSDLPLSFLDDKILHGDSLLDVSVGGRSPVNWTTAAPAVMAEGGFDAVIGNPPFLGVKNIRAAVGREVRDHYAATLLDGESGRSDLVVFFLARATQLSRNVVALVVPDAICEGDSARFGPARALDSGYRLYRAETSRPWPGAAGVRIALVWLHKAGTQEVRPCLLDGVQVEQIGPNLGRPTALISSVAEAPVWIPNGYQATIVLGKKLVLSREAAEDLVAQDPQIATWVRDYLSGEDLVSSPTSMSSRQVLDLGGTDLATLQQVPALADVLAAVRRERERQFSTYPQLAHRWWGFLNPVHRLYDALAGIDEAIAFSKHAKYIWPVLVATGPVFSNGIIVYPSGDRGLYAFLASTPHRLWAMDQGGSRLNQSFRYNPSRLRASYPFPESVEVARPAGERLAEAVADAQNQLGLGVTEVLNLVHGAGAVPAAVAALRAALIDADRAVLAAHEFDHPINYAVRQVGERTWFGPDRADEDAIKAHLLR